MELFSVLFSSMGLSSVERSLVGSSLLGQALVETSSEKDGYD